MSVAKFKRRPSGLEYVDNAFVLQKDIMMLTSKLSAKWARIYSEPITKLACMQADLVNMANGIQPSSVEDFITRRWLLMMSRACLVALEKRVMDMVRILYMNPSKCFSRKNGKNYSRAEATIMLDRRLEELGVNYQRQYDLIKGVLNSDKKKYDKIKKEDINDKDILEMLVSKGFEVLLQ